MEAQTLPLVQVTVLVVIAAVIGIVIGRLTKKNADQVEITTELEKTKTELNQHRQDLADHLLNAGSFQVVGGPFYPSGKLPKAWQKLLIDYDWKYKED